MGAILAHEQGHAKGFFMHSLSIISALDSYVGKTLVTHAMIEKSLDKETLNSAAFIEDVISYANQNTIDYFNTHGFKFNGPAQGYEYTWEKK